MTDGISNSNTVRVAVQQEIAEVQRVSGVFADLCRQCQVPPDTEGDVSLALEEALINVILHGCADEKPHDIQVCFSIESTEIILELEDDGIPYNPLNAPPPDLDVPIEQRKIGGLGVHLMKNLVDHLEYHYENGRNRLTMTKQIPEGAK